MGTHRTTEYRLIMAVIWAVCGLGLLSATVPVIEHAVTLALLTAVSGAALVMVLRIVARVLRHRREDREDALTAARWRAQHRPERVA